MSISVAKKSAAMIAQVADRRARDMAKKSAKKAGRPPLPADERLGNPSQVRFKDDERILVEEASEATGIAFSAFVRHAAVEKAMRVLGREE